MLVNRSLLELQTILLTLFYCAVLDRTQRAIAAIYTVKQSTTNILIQKRASDEAANNTKPWREVRHIFGRLLSYGQTVEVLLISRYIWPQLFRDFEVNYVVSSRSHTNPLFASPLSAEIIVGRMSLGEEKDKYLQQAQALPQKAQLDEAVEKQWTDPNFRPYVHAEILLLNWLENTGGTRPPRFFNNWPYIGASKPTCRLCDYYFKCHPNGVESRGSHGNLYPNWRFPDDPDVEEESGDIAVRTRQGLMQAITGHLRNEILRVLKEGVPFTRTHDSNTYSMFGLEQVPDILAGTSHSPRTEGSSGLGSISGDTAPSPDWTGVDAGAEQDSSSG